jgi:hypothetical protein
MKKYINKSGSQKVELDLETIVNNIENEALQKGEILFEEFITRMDNYEFPEDCNNETLSYGETLAEMFNPFNINAAYHYDVYLSEHVYIKLIEHGFGKYNQDKYVALYNKGKRIKSYETSQFKNLPSC